MIEIPRAALTADAIAEEAEFFSFGTNDLTQMTFGFSRDDAGKFLDAYYKAKIMSLIPSQDWIRWAWASWCRWLRKKAARQDPISNWVSAASTVEIRLLWNSAIRLDLPMCPVHPSAYPLRVWQRHRQLSKVGRLNLSFDLPLSFEQAAAYRKANGQYVRKNQWRETTITALIDLE